MNRAVWQPDEAPVEPLPGVSAILSPDLPGHGGSHQLAASRLDEMADKLIETLNEQGGEHGMRPAIFLGWSLGGQLAIHLARRYPDRVAALLLVACNPCFVQRPDWPRAVPAAVFEQFARDLQNNQARTLSRFLAMQMQGVDGARTLLRALQRRMAQAGEASDAALRGGLDLLLRTDLREALDALHCPVSWCFGERDTLVPAALAETLRQRYPHHAVRVIAGAGHAPFLSHANAFRHFLIDAIAALQAEPAHA